MQPWLVLVEFDDGTVTTGTITTMLPGQAIQAVAVRGALGKRRGGRAIAVPVPEIGWRRVEVPEPVAAISDLPEPTQ